MSVTINTNIIRSVPQVNDNGLVLVILKNARQTAGTVEPKRINYQSELEATYSLPVAPATAAQIKAARRELSVVEYLISRSVNLIVLATDDIGVLDTVDLAKVESIEDYNYRIILAPYSLQVNDAVDSVLIDFALDKDVELFLDIDASQSKADVLLTVADVKAAINTSIGVSYSSKVSLFLNSGLVSGFVSAFNDASYDMTDYNEADSNSIDYYGIPLSAVVASRKSAYLIAGKPWIPVAGEQTGIVQEYSSVYKRYLVTDKNAIQAADVNIVINKPGIGAVIVSQNTLARVSSSNEDKINPLIRSHVVTQALWIKRRIKSITEAIMFAPHLAKTYDTWQLKVEHFMQDIMDGDGITRSRVLTGPKVMTPTDVANNIFKGTVTYHPINVIESAVITLNILETEDAGVLVEGV